MSMTCACGSAWWVEQRVLRPAAGPAPYPQARTTPAEYRYRLVCADCGRPHGAEPAADPAPEPVAQPKPKPEPPAKPRPVKQQRPRRRS